jgi:hypothetical protein
VLTLALGASVRGVSCFITSLISKLNIFGTSDLLNSPRHRVSMRQP